MKTKVMKNSVIIMATVLIIVLGCLVSLGMIQEVRAEGVNVNAVVDERSSETTVIWVGAELWEGNRNYGDIILVIAATPIDKYSFSVETIVSIQTKDYKSDDYVTERCVLGFNTSNAFITNGPSYDVSTTTGTASVSDTTSKYFGYNYGREVNIEDVKKNNNPMVMSDFIITRPDTVWQDGQNVQNKNEKVSVELILTGLDIRGIGWAKNTNIDDKEIFSVEIVFDKLHGTTGSAVVKYSPSVLKNIEVITQGSSDEYHNASMEKYPNITI